ncbi:hypothetical protein ElyMa_006493100 [Elysia marginata]|uniref:Uncharacterized protein n=1 Tax=Elysia marginata TaxID=1093978 RepID=A0AAV4I270_9GAST|nr:hypothetical protein ElyMa_006493100 [Elysia marginata]
MTVFRWIQGAHLYVADCPGVKDAAENEVDCHLIENSTSLPDVHMDKIKKMHPARLDFESADRYYSKWPDSKQQLPTALLPDYDFRDTPHTWPTTA